MAAPPHPARPTRRRDGRRLSARTAWGRAERSTLPDGTEVVAAAAGPPGAPRVVLVHGLGVSHRYFRPLADDLAADRAVVAPDLPGFGLTPGPRRPLDVRGLSRCLADWLRTTGRERSVLVANSAGCQVVLDLARHSPELLGPCVLVGPTFDSRSRSVAPQAARLLAAMTGEAPSLVPVLVRDYLACGPARFLRTLRLLLRDTPEEKAASLVVPAVLMRGSRDALAPEAWLTRLAQPMPDVRVVQVAGVGHALNWSAPHEVARQARALGPPRDP